ncbi:MAG: DUF1501 domain-containing protein [Phycisphaerales bacterium]|nr:DUF1501 domain-containing protein [Planctomycetota bacterium]MCH8507485.1 DUF1501 domain-containing protein [Phycisphaerales bacterium]
MSLHNNPGDAKAYTRRDFLQTGALFASAALTVPAFLQTAAYALPRPDLGLSSIPGVNEDRVLVVVQLSGGNDGLNTVVPFRDDAYRRARPTIAIGPDQVRELSRNGAGNAHDIGLHPALDRVRDLYDRGLCSVIQNVGYPNPNRSHFASMDIWHTADTKGTGDGWIGRYIDSQCCGYGKGESGTPEGKPARVEPPIALGRNLPLALQGRNILPVGLESPDAYRWTGDANQNISDVYERLLQATHHPDDDEAPAAFLVRTALDARVSSDTIRRAVATPSLATYPRTEFANQLSMVGSMIRAGLKTRVYYVSLGGFDTHAGQGGAQGQHARQLTQLAEAMHAFYADLTAQGNADRVLSVCFSEFGRRVGQNASGGTDHGTAAPMFLFGPMVRAGIHGNNPNLRDLDAGDLKFQIDFRQVYAEILDRWLSTESNAVLGNRYRHLGVLARA